MEDYNYEEAVRDDVKDYIKNEVDLSEYGSRRELQDRLNDILFDNDSVTGNASGSYYCNTWKAEEALCHNFDLLKDTADELGETNILEMGAEGCDVCIRCYLLPDAINSVLDEMEEDGELVFGEQYDDDEEEEDE